MLLFFDSSLLAMGNILFLAGLSLLIGVQNTFNFFFQFTPSKIKGSVCFFGGILLVLWLSPFLGMLLELVGLYYLFGDFLPTIINFLRSVPGLNVIFYVPFVRQVRQISLPTRRLQSMAAFSALTKLIARTC
ncbi:uncharacterized protein MONBRDRAFT_14085 [Monosiga brevicollis MX1]|uniref:Uncharacterized protein n=1 Tax=Monosiga brevicollis TaxID=81824 RepID=A9UQJ2_MONBE|nr:uncharacterized protein MONBRDRAFT_14085 [Monosiga brevicollis MX1]EDQ92608.1 predicted protein [Monosiga brevicollis MX1]|eukprot:XP_001742370.1 hypothetical protein [Monosiga brevicollis MX1]